LFGPGADSGTLEPSLETAKNGSYQPLSRPLFLYVSKEAAALAHVQAFIDFYLDASRAGELVGYVPLPRAAYESAAQNFKNREFGTVFASGDLQGASIEELFAT
jgi:phosphate transport system substrate-binding protein